MGKKTTGLVSDSAYEPVNDQARRLQEYARNAFKGGANGCSEVGWIEGLTYDLDLCSAYPTLMSLVYDIDWESDKSIVREWVREHATLQDFCTLFDPAFAYVDAFELPPEVPYPCIAVNLDGSGMPTYSPLEGVRAFVEDRTALKAAMNELHFMGYNSYSFTTDGFITDADDTIANNLSLMGLMPYLRAARMALVGDDTVWEAKREQDAFYNLTTRGNMAPNCAVKDANGEVVRIGGVVAHACGTSRSSTTTPSSSSRNSSGSTSSTRPRSSSSCPAGRTPASRTASHRCSHAARSKTFSPTWVQSSSSAVSATLWDRLSVGSGSIGGGRRLVSPARRAVPCLMRGGDRLNVAIAIVAVVSSLTCLLHAARAFAEALGRYSDRKGR